MVEHGGEEAGLAGSLAQIGRVEAGRAQKRLDALGFGSQEGQSLQRERLCLVRCGASYHGMESRIRFAFRQLLACYAII